MKKLSLFFVSCLFCISVIAQNSQQLQSSPPNSIANPQQGAKPPKPPVKSNLKKTGVNKKPTHHVTPVKKAGADKNAKVDSLKR